MRPRLIIAAETGVLIGMVGLALYQARLLRQAREDLRAALETPELPADTNQRPVRLRLRQFPQPSVRTQIRDLDWSSVESDDYVRYVANLRRIGCPEQTIRDIIEADVAKLFEAKRRALEPPPADWDFWRGSDDADGSEGSSEDLNLRKARLAALDRERRELVMRLLGPAGAEAQLENFREEGLRDRSLQFLPLDKRQAVAEAIAHWRQAVTEGTAIADDAQRTDRLAAAERGLNDQLSAILNPEEREQFEMRASPLADHLRNQLRGFDASREEFEQLFRIEKQLGEQSAAFAAAAGNDSQAQDRIEAAQVEAASKIKEMLGDQRFPDYQRSQDPDYRTLYSLALSHEVPTSVANQVWDMRRAVEQQTDRIRANPLLTGEQKERALEAIRNETQTSIVSVLGQPLLEAYQQQGGAWLNELTSPANLGPSYAPESETASPPLAPAVSPQALGAPQP